MWPVPVMFLCTSLRLSLLVFSFGLAFSTDASDTPTTTAAAPTATASTLASASTAPRTPAFLAGTLVMMADGAQKPVETIEFGEQVWGGEKVLFRHVDYVPAGTVVNAFDGEEPWAVAGYAFIDEQGRFATTNTEVAFRVDPALEGQTVPLTDETRVLRYDGTACAPADLTSATLQERTLVYSVVLVGPGHVYPANGWMVFDYYPHLGHFPIASRVMLTIYRRETRRLNQMFADYGPQDVARMDALLADISAVVTKHLGSRPIKNKYAGAPMPQTSPEAVASGEVTDETTDPSSSLPHAVPSLDSEPTQARMPSSERDAKDEL